MKLVKGEKFQPLTIEIQTQEEFDILANLLFKTTFDDVGYDILSGEMADVICGIGYKDITFN